MNGEEVLVAAKEHLHDGENWVKGKYSKDRIDWSSGSPQVVSTHDHCLMGAVQCVIPAEMYDSQVVPLLDRLTRELRDAFIAYAPARAERISEMNAQTEDVAVESMNDFFDTTWEDIDKVLDKAIARAGELGL